MIDLLLMLKKASRHRVTRWSLGKSRWLSSIFLIMCLLLVISQNQESLAEKAKEKLSNPQITILEGLGVKTDQETMTIRMHILDENGIQNIWLTINASQKITVDQFENIRWNENQTEVTITTKISIQYGKNLIFIHAENMVGQANRKKLVIIRNQHDKEASWSNTVRRSLYYLFKRIAQAF